jgi:N-acetyl-gamma-glutamyl-phosphate reductase
VATAELLAAGVRVIDLSADHRFDDPTAYAAIYGEHQRPESLAHTVYGLAERNREAIREARLVGCPGCFPTSVILAASPARFAGLLAPGEIIADCKTGVSGAGRSPGAGTHFPETSEGLHAYKTLAHRHAPEMSRALDGMTVRFVPHLVPMNRGILATVYLRLTPGTTAVDVRRAYAAAYADEPFVQLLGAGQHPDTRNVRGTNRCHLGLFVDGDLLVVQSAIDNLGKGAAGQAIQNLNLMAGLPETTGLTQTALFP